MVFDRERSLWRAGNRKTNRLAQKEADLKCKQYTLTAHGMLEHTRIISQIRSMASLESIHRNFTDMQHSISLGVSDYVLY